jgi:SAM-dependent methyltransferase
VPGDESPAWDRSAELDRIRATYAGYDAVGRGRLWDRSNRGYARLSQDLADHVLAELRRCLPGVSGGQVLDLGCGAGQLLDRVLASGLRPSWTGVDLRPEAVEAARAAHPDASFLVASADDVPVADATVDVVVAELLFSSLPSATLERAVAAEIGRVLRPTGWLVWSDLRYDNPANPAVHGIDARRLGQLFPGWTIEVETAGLLPPLARRLGRLAPAAYAALTGIPPLRSHLVGRLQPAATS